MADALNPKIYILTFTAFVMLSSEFIVAGLLPEIAAGLHISVGQAGWLVTAFALGMGIGAPVIAAFTHKVSLRALLMSGCVALFCGNTISALTDNFSLLMIGRALGGIGVAIFWTNAALTASAMSSASHKSLAVSRVLIGISIASVVGVPLGKLVSDTWNWEIAMGLMAALSALALLAVIRWIHPPQTDAPVTHRSLGQRLRSVWTPDIALALLSYLLMFAGVMAVFSYLATFLARYTGLTGTPVTLMLALYGVSDIVGNLLLSKRVPDQLDGLFKALLLVLAVSLAALSLLGQSVWLVPVVVIAIGCCHAGASLLTGVDVLRRAGANAQFIGAVNVSAINLGIMLGTSTGGLLVDHIGLQYIGFLAAGFVLCAWVTRTRLSARPVQSEHLATE
jgi:DHA1 family inner membrane transport protein